MTNNFINEEKLKKAKSIIRAIDHPLRKSILNLIYENPKISVTEIYVKLRIDQSVCSQNLKILRDENLVIFERKGKNIFYRIEEVTFLELGKFFEKVPLLETASRQKS